MGYKVVDSDKSLKYNQLFKASSSYISNGATMTYNDGVLSLSGTSTGSYCNNSHDANVLGINQNGHKYLTIINTLTNPNNITINFSFHNGRLSPSSTTISSIGTHYFIGTCNTSYNKYFGFTYSSGTITDGFSCKIMIIDLTDIYGLGQEPTTLDEFYATPQGKLYKNNYIPYGTWYMYNTYNIVDIKTNPITQQRYGIKYKIGG